MSAAGSYTVGDDEHLGEFVDGDDRGQAEHARRGERYQGHEDGARQQQVLTHDPTSPAGMGEHLGQVVQVVAHERDVGGFDGDVAAGSSHRDADRGGRERRSVVDAVADHRDRADPTEVGDDRRLVLWQQLCANLVHTCLGAECGGGATVVAGEHHDLLDAVSAQRRDGLRGVCSQLVTDCDQP